MNAPLAKPERGMCTSLRKAPAPRRDNRCLLQLFLPAPVAVRSLFIARSPSKSQLDSEKRPAPIKHVFWSRTCTFVPLPSQFLSAHQRPPPAPFGLRMADAPRGCARPAASLLPRGGEGKRSCPQGLGERGASAGAPFTCSHHLNEPRSPFPSAAVTKRGLSLPRQAGAVQRRPSFTVVGLGWGCKRGAPGSALAPGGLRPSPVLYSIAVLFIRFSFFTKGRGEPSLTPAKQQQTKRSLCQDLALKSLKIWCS